MGKYYYLVFKTRAAIKLKAFLSRILPQQKGYEKFVIICSARTGSTLLHTYLNSHPHIFSQGEVLRERQSKQRSINLENHIFRPQGSNIRAVGLKYFLDYIEDARFSNQYAEILADPSIKIIVLSREQARAQLKSLKLAKANQEWSFAGHKSKPSIALEQAELTTYISKLDRQYAQVKSDLQQHQIFSMTYEQLTIEPTKTLTAVQVFLNVTPRKLYSVLRKQG